jgi:hypothetical protein
VFFYGGILNTQDFFIFQHGPTHRLGLLRTGKIRDPDSPKQKNEGNHAGDEADASVMFGHKILHDSKPPRYSFEFKKSPTSKDEGLNQINPVFLSLATRLSLIEGSVALRLWVTPDLLFTED